MIHSTISSALAEMLLVAPSLEQQLSKGRRSAPWKRANEVNPRTSAVFPTYQLTRENPAPLTLLPESGPRRL